MQQQAQNVKELEQLQANSRTQLLLQESVEGLSVVAITYYSTGVLGYPNPNPNLNPNPNP